MNKHVLIPLICLLVWGGRQGPAIQEAYAEPAAGPDRAHSDTPQQQVSAPAPETRTTGHDLVLGESVFTNTCLTCHGKGLHDAPVLGNAEHWAPRLEQDLDTLIGHAIHGHRGMPPRGGFSQLSDQEVAAAVAYAVDHGEKILAAMQQEQGDQRCDPVNNLDKCSAAELRDMLTIQMLWLLGGKGGE
jgi:cytochrome c5